MKVRVLVHQNNDNIRIGPAISLEGDESIENLAIWLKEQYDISSESGEQPIGEHYQRIAIVGAEDLRSIKHIYTRQ